MDLNHLISNAQHLPNIPKVVQELIQSFGDENINSDAIAAKLSQDQSMTAKVLRMANSSKYGGHRNVGSVNDAVVLLGFNALRTMVLASGLTSSFPTPEGFDTHRFWVKSFTIGSICKWVARHTSDVDGEIAFTCGMIHDIGGLLTHILVNEEALAIDEVVAKGADRVEMEECRLGFNFAEAGSELACRWKFPKEIVDGIRYQLNPTIETEDGEEFKALAGMILIAKYLYEHREEEQETLVSNFPTETAKALNVDMVSLINDIEELASIDEGIEELLA